MILPDVLENNLKAVFVGTAAGTTSKETGTYYARKGNNFWPILAACGLTPCELKPHEFERLREFGLGLTDLAKLTWGVDKKLAQSDYDIEGFEDKIRRYEPRVVAFTSKNAAKAYFGHEVQYGPQEGVLIGVSQVYVLPSTSGQNGHWRKLVQWWHRFIEYLKTTQERNPPPAKA